MRRLFRLSFLILLTVAGAWTFSDLSVDAAQTTQSFDGEYQWSQGGDGALEAEFRPDGEDQWKIKFRFKFSSRDYTWKGTAEGSLEDGSPVTGTAKGGGGRTWEFEGTVQDGVMIAKHAEKRGGSLQQTGSFKISRR